MRSEFGVALLGVWRHISAQSFGADLHPCVARLSLLVAFLAFIARLRRHPFRALLLGMATFLFSEEMC